MATSTEILDPEAAKHVRQFQKLTDDAQKIKVKYAENAEKRREVIRLLRKKGWSFRRIGETINVSGQRIDSMLRLGKPTSTNGDGEI